MAHYDLALPEYRQIIKKRKLIILSTAVLMGLLSFMLAMILAPTPLFRAVASVKLEKSPQNPCLHSPAAPIRSGDDLQTQLVVISSFSILESAAKKLGMIPEHLSSEEILGDMKYIDVIGHFNDMLKAEQESRNSIINVTATSDNPKFAMRLANTVVFSYMEQRSFELNKKNVTARIFMEEQLASAKDKLANAENALKNLRIKKNIHSIESQSNALLSQSTTDKKNYDNALKDYAGIKIVIKQLNEVRNRPLTSDMSFYLEKASPGYKALNDELVRHLMKRDTLLVFFKDDDPQVVEVKKLILETTRHMLAQLQARSYYLKENIRMLEERIRATTEEMNLLPGLSSELARLERNIKINMEVCSLLEKNYQESLIKEAEKVCDVQIIRHATEPRHAINLPNTNAAAAIGALLGLIFGTIIALVSETFKTSIGTIEEIETLLGAPVLGIIPERTAKDLKKILEENLGNKRDENLTVRAARLPAHFAPQSTLSETYRILRTNINFTAKEKDLKSIAFTSASPKEGKTTAIANLAVTMAQTGRRILLVEGDLRRPVLAEIFGIDQTPGLTDAMLDNFDWKKSIKTITDMMIGKLNIDEVLVTPGMDNLHIMPAGTVPPNPSELINSKAFSDFLNWAQSNYDFVLIDAPPVLAATDAALIGSKADGVVIVYRPGKVPKITLRRAKRQLENVKAHVIGVVLNGLESDIYEDFADYDRRYYLHHDGGTKPMASHWKSFKMPSGRESEIRENRHPSKNISYAWLAVILLALMCFAAGMVLWQQGYLMHINKAHTESRAGKTAAVKKTIARSSSHTALSPDQAGDQKTVVSTDGIEKASTIAPPQTPAMKATKSSGSAKKFYAVQIKAERSLDEALAVVDTLKKAGFDAHCRKAILSDRGIWYRILIGHFESREEAQNYFSEKKIADSYSGSWVRTLEH